MLDLILESLFFYMDRRILAAPAASAVVLSLRARHAAAPVSAKDEPASGCNRTRQAAPAGGLLAALLLPVALKAQRRQQQQRQKRRRRRRQQQQRQADTHKARKNTRDIRERVSG